MDIPEKDPNKSDEDLSEQMSDELPNEDSASNMEEDDGMNEANLELLRLSLGEDRTPTDPGTGEALFSEPPPLPRIKELRSEILTSPPVRRRSSRKLDFPPEVGTPENSPENKSPKVTSDNPFTFGKELYESMPGSSAEIMKRRLSLTNPVNPFLLLSRRRHSEDQSAQSPNLELGESHSQGQSAQSPNIGLGGSHSQGQAPFLKGLRRRHSGGQSTQSPILGLGRSQSQSPSSPNIGLGGSHSEDKSAQNPNLRLGRGHIQGQSAQSPNLGFGGSHSQGQAPFLKGLRRRHSGGQSTQSPILGLGRSQSHSPSSPNLRLVGSHSQDQSAPNPILRLGGSHSQGQSAQNPNLGLRGNLDKGQSPFLIGSKKRHCKGQSAQSPNLGESQDQSAQSPTLGLGESHSQGQPPLIPNLGLINTAAQCFTRNIMSDAIPESLALSPNVQPPATPQAKRSLDKSPSESGSSGSPGVVKRHRRIPSSVPEDRPAAHVQRRRSHEFSRNEPEVRREPRKRSYSSGQDETKEKQQKKD